MSSPATTAIEVSRRLERFSTWPWPPSVLILTGIAYFFGLFDVLTLGVSAPVIAKQMGVRATELAAVGSILALIGYPLGGLGLAHVADALGRRRAIVVTLLAYSLGSLLTAAATNVYEIYAFRFITGIGIGADLAVVAAYLNEMTPANARGRYQSFATFLGFVGAGISPLLGYFLVTSLSYGWRIYFIVGGLGAIATLFARRGLPESPRWLLAKGRVEEARKIVEQLEEYQKKKVGDLPPLPEVKGGITLARSKVPLFDLFSRKHGWRLILLLVVYLVYYAFTYPFLTLTPSLLASSGYSIARSLFAVGIGGLGYAVGAGLASLTADYMERKYLISLVFVLHAIGLILIGLKSSVAEVIVADFITSLANTWLVTLLYVYAAENFPSSARSNGVAATEGLGHISPIFTVGLTVAVFNKYGFFTAYLMLGLFAIAAAIIVLPGIRATRRYLEEVAE